MAPAAPRIDARLVTAIERLDDPGAPIAETNRRVGVVAAHLGLPRPSYEQVRVLVHDLRAKRPDTSVGSVLLEIAFRAAPPEALLDLLAGDYTPRRAK